MEILVLVELFDFRKRASAAMPLSQLNPGRGINRAFEVKMQIGLW